MTRAWILCLLFAGGGAAQTDNALRQAYERTVYSWKDSGHGVWRGENRAQQLAIEFDFTGARLTHPDGHVEFHLTGYGYGERLRKPERPRLIATGTRLEYRRGDLTEWYVNGPQGLEQGFTLNRRLQGSGNGPLTIALGITGDLPLEQKDGALLLGNAFRYNGLTARDAYGRAVPSRMEVRGREIRLLIDDRNAQYPLVIDPTWTQQTEISDPNGDNGDYFGCSVSVSGSIAVIGSTNYNTGAGTAYVFVQNGSTWMQQAQLTPPDGADEDAFGTSVAAGSNRVAIGASMHGSNGAVYVYYHDGPSWILEAELTSDDGSPGDLFGNAVTLYDSTVVAGAPNHTVGVNSSQGAAYVFVQNDGWLQHAELTASDGVANDSFGTSVALSVGSVTVGAVGHPYDAGTGNPGPGAVYVFVRDESSTWSQQAELTPRDGSSGDNFGISTSNSGDMAVIGSNSHPNDPVNGNGPGATYVFVQNRSAWSQQAELMAVDSAPGDNFGQAVSLLGDAVLVGAPAHPNDPLNGNGPGAAYLFVQNGSSWTQQAELTSNDGEGGDAFGQAVALNGATALIGAPVTNGYSGTLYLFQFPPASLSITPTHSSPVFQSGPATVTLTVTNTGGPTVGTISVFDTIDSGLAINSTCCGCGVSGQRVTCAAAPNHFDASSIWNIYVTAGASAAASISNSAMLDDPLDAAVMGSYDTIAVTAQAPQVDSSLSQIVLSGSTDNGTCASGNMTLTATDQLQNTTGATLTNPYAVIQTLSGGNTLMSQSADSASVAPGAYVTFTFHIQLATCNTFQLIFDVRSN